MRYLLLLALLLTVAGHALAAPAGLPDLSVFPNSLGVNIHFTDPRPGELDQIYAAGFRWVRMDFQWAGIERKKGEYDFSAYDRLIAALDQHHMHAVFILDYGNRNYDDGLSPHSDKGREAFAKWAAASVHHFKGHGIFWEMWNEPNGGFWKPAANVDDYAKLALTVGQTLQAAEPGEIYIGPATSTIDLPFLEACFKAGCLEYWSAVSVHPYRQHDPETVPDEYRTLRQLIARYAPKDRKIPIISGEWGYSSAWQYFDEDRQAKYLPRELLTNIANNVALSIWYDWHEDGKDPKEPEHHFGIVRPDPVNKDGNLYEPKKAYLVARRMAEILDGYHLNKRLWFFSPENEVLLFENAGGKLAIVAWTTGEKKSELTLPITGGAVVSDAFGPGKKEAPADSKGLSVLLDQYPTYILPAGNEDLLRVAANWSRMPLEMSVSGPAVLSIDTTVRNPLDHPITILRQKLPIIIKPGETRLIEQPMPVGRQAESLEALVGLNVENLGNVWQESSIVITNPLSVQLVPQMGKVQFAIIHNPTGEPVHAIAELNTTPANQTITTSQVEMKAGDKQTVVAFSVNRDVSGGLESVRLISAEGSLTLVQTPLERRVLLPGFSGDPSQSWKAIADGDAKVTSEQVLSNANPPGGTLFPGDSSLKLAYRFDKGWKFLRISPAEKTPLTLEGKPAAIGLWIFGDGRGNLARMRLTDSTGQTLQPDGSQISWQGWRYVEFQIAGREFAHWGGADDGKVHFPVHLDTLFLLDSAKRAATHGEIYLSTPTVIYGK